MRLVALIIVLALAFVVPVEAAVTPEAIVVTAPDAARW